MSLDSGVLIKDNHIRVARGIANAVTRVNGDPRHVECFVHHDLDLPVGPHIAKALERTREAVFVGEISAEEARSFAQRMAIKYLNREQVSDVK